jgi:23S rRNA (uracil1939-C5)-methyltransferase
VFSALASSWHTPQVTHFPIRMTVDAVVPGGHGIGRNEDGRVVLVPGALPGEVIDAQPYDTRARLIKANLIQVVKPSPLRREVPCEQVAKGCGGCDWQHVRPEAALELKREIVIDALVRIAKIDRMRADEVVTTGGFVHEVGYRTTMRCGVLPDGRLGLRRAGSNELIAAAGCMVAHPGLHDTLEHGRFPVFKPAQRKGWRSVDPVTGDLLDPGADAGLQGNLLDVIIRIGTADNAVVAQVNGPGRVSVPDDVEVVQHRGDAIPGADVGIVHEEVNGATLRVGIGSFFQSGPEAAGLLSDTIAEMIVEVLDREADILVDLYGGVGMIACTVPANHLVVVEQGLSAVADAAVNTSMNVRSSRIVHMDAAAWRPNVHLRGRFKAFPKSLLASDPRIDGSLIVVADPPRSGLGRLGVEAATSPQPGPIAIVLVSCDPAAGARDIGLFAERGFSPAAIRVLDLFPNTHHLEMVTVLLPDVPDPRSGSAVPG